MKKDRIAIFDLDETLTQKGTWGRFVTGIVKDQPLKWAPFALSTAFTQAHYMLGLGPRERVKERMMQWTIAGRSRSELERLAQEFADNEVQNGLRRKAREVIEHHRNAGDRIMIASAAVDLIVHPIADHLNIDDRICTATAFDENQRLKKRLGGVNCYGPNKLKLVREYLENEPGFNRENVHITVYSDSRSDLDIFDWADVGIAVNPSPRLLKCVNEHGLNVQDWDKE
ncbi:MAG: HAD-IB family hydrolase [Acidimicrobiales bacterium]|nr:HAD-IB family hydrolase [Hyphomonadaceae bacterium]RZV35769.1 MAG: HAD-IB family hydrolase [Acidimicrobiales bacterium]